MQQCDFENFLYPELPSLLPIVDVAEALLHVKNGAWFLCLLVANVPDSFNEGELQFLLGQLSFSKVLKLFLAIQLILC